MGLVNVLLTCSYIVAVIGSPHQRNRTQYNKNKIPSVTSDSRPECALVNSLKDAIPNCSLLLPIDAEYSFFETKDVLVCFGVYDTYYQLCKYNTSLTEIKIPDFETQGFCGRAKTAFDNYEFEHKEPLLKVWAPRLRTTLSNKDNCTSVCIFNEELDLRCSLIVRALEIYRETLKNASLFKPAEVPPVVQSPIKTIGPPVGTESKPSSPDGTDVASVVDGGPVVASPAVASQAAASPHDTLSKPNGPAYEIGAPPIEQSQSSIVPPKDLRPVQSKPEKTVQEIAEESPIEPNLADEEAEQQSQDPEPDAGEPKDDTGVVPDDSVQLTHELDRDRGDLGKTAEQDLGLRPIMMGRLDDDEESNLVTYFILMTGGALLFYVAFHNKNKLLALALEGRRANRRGGRNSTAAYSKLHSNLEEAIAAGPTSPSATHVLY